MSEGGHVLAQLDGNADATTTLLASAWLSTPETPSRPDVSNSGGMVFFMTVKMADVPLGDRPRERLLRQGAAALSDAELIAVQLGSGHAGASALEVAQRLVAEWGGIAGLATARPEELARNTGVGPAKAARLVAAFGLASRASAVAVKPALLDSSDIAREAAALIGKSRAEQVAVLVADGASRLRRTEVVAMGSAKSCPVPVREIIATVLRHDGVAFAVAHNHPGGDPAPTHADVMATDALRHAAGVVGVRFLDHVVIAGSVWRSVLVVTPSGQ